jgi:septum formation protein
MQNSSEEPLLILASKSPRRRYLLKQAGLSFIVIPSQFDESNVPLSSPEVYVKFLAEAKANQVSEDYPEKWIIGADTIVMIEESLLGKPESRAEARLMLKRLSGKTHQVFTGDVRFKNLSDTEIEWYIRTNEPFDKAGAYAIQGLGTFLVKSIKGSYTNVVGLPVCEVIEFLIDEGIIGLRQTGQHTTKENDT